MTVYRKLKFVVAAFLFILMGCAEGETVFDDIVDQEQRGAVIRTVELISNELPIGVADAGFSGVFEVQTDDNDAADFVEVYVGYRDNTVEDGAPDNSVAQTLYETLDSSTFEIGEFGYPRFNYELSLSDMLSFTGTSEDDLFGGDQFEVRYELVLDDGRRFSFDDNTGTLTGSFFSSPFLYTPTVVCPVGAEQFVGTYVITDVTGGVFGTVWGDGTVVELSIGETSTQRSFAAVYLPQFAIGNGPATFTFDLVCEQVNVPASQGSGLQCSSGITLGPPRELDLGVYDQDDDSSFTITFREDEADDCGGGVDVTVLLTKQ
ncbi:MAG: hypothetical protein P8X60_01130 [Robiginitalea sp.]|jgi:hypothetical protein